MKINKIYLIIPIALFLISCKEESKTTVTNLKTEIKDVELNNDCLKKRSITSIVHSCGGGCAVSYNEKKVAVADSLIKIEYKGTSYIDEEIEEEFKGSFYIRCNNKNKATNVFFEGNPDENMLDVKVNSISESFQKYSDELCSCIKQSKSFDQVQLITDEGYTCEDIEITNSFEEPMYKICNCNYTFSKCYSFFYSKIDVSYKELLLKQLPQKDTTYIYEQNKIEFQYYKRDSLRISIIEEGAEEFLFKKEYNKTRIEFYVYSP